VNWGIAQELRRKAFHLSILLVIVLYVIIERSVSRQVALFTLVFVLLILLAMEYLRLELNIDVPFVDRLLRAKEHRRMNGAIYFLSATIILIGVLDFKIALAALLMTTFGDLSASLVGQQFGKTYIFKNKTVKGCAGELVINLIVGFIVLQNIYIILAMALTATVVETFVNELEDNLFVPLFAGFVGQLIFFLL
tara:strand:- start:323 stop:904 length:582 start_codon:yes stop_codon:yes gene_type:complete